MPPVKPEPVQEVLKKVSVTRGGQKRGDEGRILSCRLGKSWPCYQANKKIQKPGLPHRSRYLTRLASLREETRGKKSEKSAVANAAKILSQAGNGKKGMQESTSPSSGFQEKSVRVWSTGAKQTGFQKFPSTPRSITREPKALTKKKKGGRNEKRPRNQTENGPAGARSNSHSGARLGTGNPGKSNLTVDEDSLPGRRL